MMCSAPTRLAMRVCDEGKSADVVVTLADTAVTVAEVFEALRLPTNATIDGRVVVSPEATPAHAVFVGGCEVDARRDVDHDVEGAAPRLGSVELSIVAGLDAGRTASIVPGVYRLASPAEVADGVWYLKVTNAEVAPAAQPWHLHGAGVEAVVGSGFVVVLTRPIAAEPGYGRHVHRPPRVLPPVGSEPIAVVQPPPEVQPPGPLSWAAMLAPVPIAVLMAVLFRPLFALFSLVGPVMALGRWWEDRRRFRRQNNAREMVIHELREQLSFAVNEQAETESSQRWLRYPHVGELWRRARYGSVRLWERRPQAPDYLVVAVGVSDDLVSPIVDSGTRSPEIHALLDVPVTLRSVPHVVDLAANPGIGLHGPHQATLAVARSVVLQLATLHGPADLTVALLASRANIPAWDWLKWLPHTDRCLIAESAAELVSELRCATPARGGRHEFRQTASDDAAPGPVVVVIVDDPVADVAAVARASHLAGLDIRVIAIASQATALPALCSSLVAVRAGIAELATPELTGRRRLMCPIGLSAPTATSWARSLCALTDPEARVMSVSDDAVSLLQLLGHSTAAQLRTQWRQRESTAAPTATIGSAPDGPYTINLTDDGPHALVAGTTGSGKSELLRTLVISLAVQCPPDQLNFVLVDFKGGGAFDAVEGLPHVAGVITDLDEILVSRAISSLRSELQRRETVFRSLGVSSYELATVRSADPLARLVVVIDEFAVLAADYPELMTSIVDLAARGRSLGMHLVLATQRPTGVIDQKIRANTNLRIALRMQDAFDSHDVVGVGDAADIDRKSPGHAVVRVGGDPPIMVRTAFCGAPDRRADRCRVQPLALSEPPGATSETLADGLRSELEVLIEAVHTANASRPMHARALWSEPLPETLDWIDLSSRGLASRADTTPELGYCLGLADVPDKQSHRRWHWDPSTGSLVLFGASALDAGKILVSLGAAILTASRQQQAHLYVIDGDSGRLAPLEDLPITGAYIRLSEADRIERAITFMERTLAARTSCPNGGPGPPLVLAIDNIAAVLTAIDGPTGVDMADRLAALARDGSPHRVHLVMTARTAGDVGHRLLRLLPNRLVLRLADPHGYLLLGLRSNDVGPMPDMRGIDLATSQTIQLVEPPTISALAAIGDAETSASVHTIQTLPLVIDRCAVSAARQRGDNTLTIPLAIDADHLGEACLEVPRGEHALIAGAPRMGKSSTLLAIVEQLASVRLLGRIGHMAPSRSPLSQHPCAGEAITSAARLQLLAESVHPSVLVIDDADLISTELERALRDILVDSGTNLRIIAATTLDSARAFRSWTGPIRARSNGAILGGKVSDGDIFGVRRDPIFALGEAPGRGHLVTAGRSQAVQFVRPDT